MSLRMWRSNGPKISVENYDGYFDIPYGTDSEMQKLDIYLPESSIKGPFPVIISIHGGGYVACDKRESEMIIPMLSGLKRGYAIVGLNYRLAGEKSFPYPVKDIKQAIRFLKANAEKYNLDASKFVTWGGSAGGYMTLMSCLFANEQLFDNRCDPNLDFDASIAGGVAWYPQTDFATTDEELRINSTINYFLRAEITDVSDEYEPAFPKMEDSQFPYHEAPGSVIEQFLGVPFVKDCEEVRISSPINYITKDKNIPPIFIQHGSNDEILPMQQSIRFTNKANDMTNDTLVQLEIIPNAIHSSILFETEENLTKVLDFIDRVTQD